MNKLLKRAMVFTLTVLLSTTGVFAAVPDDVKGQGYEAAVSALMDKGIITGDSDGNFNPDATLNRAQACIIIVKSMNPPAAEVVGTATQAVAKSDFSDMSGYGWAEGYVAYAVVHGVTKGYPDGTFRPGSAVTMNELVTMILRAADYNDVTLGGTWPSNYMEKARELNLLAGTPDPLPANATKWIAALVDYNALAQIEKANPQQETPSTTPEETTNIPDTEAMLYAASGSFNSAMDTYDGKTISDEVKIYTYGLKASFSSTMTFTTKAADYRQDTVFKYKNVTTPAYYKIEDNKIVAMVLPKDTGFSGFAYVVINGTYSSSNAKGETVTGLNTLAATKEIKWLGEKGLANVPSKTGSDSYLSGLVYELKLSEGQIKSVNKSTESFKGKTFEELTKTGFVVISDYSDDNVLESDDGNLYSIKENATVYTLDGASADEYEVGRQSDIKKGNEIRIYDISDDDDAAGDIVVVRLK